MIVPGRVKTTADVALHYDELDLAYRRIWGEHVHHGYWRTGRETPTEATEALSELVARGLRLAPGQEVCDIGCGYGATAGLFAGRYGVQVTGFTVSAAQQQIAAERDMAGVTCLCRDWLENGQAEASFDRAYAIESSEHMADKARFFVEASRVLRPGGRFVVCAWLAGDDARPWEVRHLLEPICVEGRLPSIGTRADYEALAAEAGLVLESYADISGNVWRTWAICLRRLALGLVRDPALRALAFSRRTQSRSFILSLPRLLVALRIGAMRYGVFVWRKPG